jgi:hypothetical protein
MLIVPSPVIVAIRLGYYTTERDVAEHRVPGRVGGDVTPVFVARLCNRFRPCVARLFAVLSFLRKSAGPWIAGTLRTPDIFFLSTPVVLASFSVTHDRAIVVDTFDCRARLRFRFAWLPGATKVVVAVADVRASGGGDRKGMPAACEVMSVSTDVVERVMVE